MKKVLTEKQKEVLLKMVYAMEDFVEVCLEDDELNVVIAEMNIFNQSLDEIAYKLECAANEGYESEWLESEDEVDDGAASNGVCDTVGYCTPTCKYYGSGCETV